MRYIIILLFCFLKENQVRAQSFYEIDFQFNKGRKKINNVDFFYILNDTAIRIAAINDKLLIPSFLLKEEKVNVLMLYSNKKVEFKILPKDLFYLKINVYKEYFFLCRYEINQGFDYVEIAKKTKKKYIYKKE
jgi:hypothetical protein